MAVKEKWDVSIYVDDDRILTIGHGSVSGLEDIEEYRDTVIEAIKSLSAFIGYGLDDRDFPACPECETNKEDGMRYCAYCGRSLR
jgi:hypothetical protein